MPTRPLDFGTSVMRNPAFFTDGYWAGILGFSRYLISAEGRVLSVKKTAPARLLKPIKMGAYLGLQIVDDSGRLHKKYVHRLVLEACLGPPEAGDEARHLNGNRFDNRLANLAWGTRSENFADKVRHGTSNHGERNAMAKLTVGQVEQMRALYAAGGWSFKTLAAHFGVSAMTAYRAVRRQSWTL